MRRRRANYERLRNPRTVDAYCLITNCALEHFYGCFACQQVGDYVVSIVSCGVCAWANWECSRPYHPRRVCTLRDWVEAFWPLLCTDDDFPVTVNICPLVEVDEGGVVIEFAIYRATHFVCAPEALLRELEQRQHNVIGSHQLECGLNVLRTNCWIYLYVRPVKQV